MQNNSQLQERKSAINQNTDATQAKSQTSESEPISSIANFRERAAPVYVAYPPDYGIPLQSSDLREAVQQRTLKLANDVSDQTAARIQSYIFDEVDKHKADKGIPQAERRLLVRRINGILGRQRF